MFKLISKLALAWFLVFVVFPFVVLAVGFTILWAVETYL